MAPDRWSDELDDWPAPFPKSAGDKELDRFTETLTSIADDGWREDAACLSEAPQLWDLDFYETREQADAAGLRLCAGCPVKRLCALDALEPMQGARKMVGVIRAGVAMSGGAAPALRLRKVAGLSGGGFSSNAARIRELHSEGWLNSEIAAEVGVSARYVATVIRG